jgi:putative ABC transport system permease protein
MPNESWVPRWRRYLRFWRANVPLDVDEEFQFHVQERVDDLVALGADPRLAREEAVRRFGDIERVKGTCRTIAHEQEHDMRRAEVFSVIKQDIVYSLRLMRAHPSITTAIAITLALGIGATTAIFSVVNAVLLRPLPFTDSDRVVLVSERFRENNGRASSGHFHDWAEQSRVFEAITAWQQRNYNLTDGEPTRLFGARVTPNFFQVQHMPPAVGRYFLPTEAPESRVAVISHPLWQTRFAGDPAIVGKTITLNGEAHTVVGVTPARFTLTQFDERLWTPLSFSPEQRTNYGAHFLAVFAKLKPGQTVEQAQRDLERVTEDIRRREPQNMKDRGVIVQSFTDVLIGDYRTQLWVLLGAVVFVLFIGCANVASLLLARAMSRRKEIAIRAALGGARARLVGQLLTESMLLALAGGALGLLVAKLGVGVLVNAGPSWVPRLQEAGLQLDVLAFAAAATIVCGLLFGLAPALRATRLDLQSELREGGRGSRTAVGDRARTGLLVTEVAVALLLIVSAGLFLQSAIRMQNVAIGFEPNGVTMTRIALPADRYDSARAVNDAFLRIVERIRAIPGVQAAAAGTRVPMWGGSIDMGIRIDGRPQDPNTVNVAHTRLVTPGFMETLGIPLRRGRLLAETDIASGAAAVVVVNETLARTIFGDANPIGQRISGWTKGPEPEWREIVGVVGDVRAFGRENDIPPEVFIPLTQAPQDAWNAFQRAATVVVKASGGTTVAPAIRSALLSIDPMIPLYDLQTMDDVLEQSTATRRFNTMLLTLLGITGLALAAIGIYGVMAFFVGQRTHEIGVRVALGASTSSVVLMVVRQAVAITALGIAVGGVAAFWATRVLASLLFQTEAHDPVAFIAGASVLLLVGLAASWLPARRAARVEPVRALAAAG